jgi:hypothetical protein
MITDGLNDVASREKSSRRTLPIVDKPSSTIRQLADGPERR